jgi:protoporphyrinogen IX oxidase
MSESKTPLRSIARVIQPLVLIGIVGAIFSVWRGSFNAAKVIHILAVISWFAGLFYLPRLFVYHAMATDSSVTDTLKVMEYKLFTYIMQPAMLITLGAGVWMLWLWNWAMPMWLHWKLALVGVLFVYHVLCHRHLRRFATNTNARSHIYFRWFNEVPTLILIAVVILVVVKPSF